MKTVGSILREARTSRNLTLDQVEKDTKIRRKFLSAIESDNYAPLPSLSYAKGFVRNYSEYLGLNSSNVMAFFRRQTKEAPKSSLLPKGVAEPLNRTLFQLTPGRFIFITVSALVVLFLGYFILQYQRLQKPPTLIIESPAEGALVSEKTIEVWGKTDPDATVTVNGVSVLIRSDGKFFEQVGLEPGENTINVVATSRFGKTVEMGRKVGLRQ